MRRSDRNRTDVDASRRGRILDLGRSQCDNESYLQHVTGKPQHVTLFILEMKPRFAECRDSCASFDAGVFGRNSGLRKEVGIGPVRTA